MAAYQSAGHSRRAARNSISESKVPAGFKEAVSNIGNRRHRGFIRSEVKKSMTTFLIDTTKEYENPAPFMTNLDPAFERTSAKDLLARHRESSNSSTFAPAQMNASQQSDSHHDNSGATAAYPQPTSTQLVAMDAFRSTANQSKPSNNTKAPRSDISSLEIVVDSCNDQQTPTNQKASYWTRSGKATERSDSTWDNSGHDVERFVSLNPPPSLNNLKKRVPPPPTVNAGSATPSVVHPAIPAVAPPCKNEKLSSVPLPQLGRTSSELPKTPTHTIAQPSYPITPRSPVNLICKSKDMADAPTPSIIEKMNNVKNDVAAPVDPFLDRTDKARIIQPGAFAPHLRPKTVFTEASADLNSKSCLPPHLRHKTDFGRTAPKSQEKRTIHPHIGAAENKNILNRSEKGNDIETSATPTTSQPLPLPPHIRASPILTPKTTNAAAVKVQEGANIARAGSQIVSYDTKVPERGSSSAQTVEESVSPSQNSLKLMATQRDDWATSCAPSGTGPDNLHTRAGVNESNSRDVLPLPESPAALKSENTDPSKIACPKTTKTTSSKEAPCDFPWISGEPEASLVGWDGKMKPAPVGEEWAMRELHDPTDASRDAVISTWARDLAQDQEEILKKIDLDDPDFLTGRGIVEDADLQQAIEASLHSVSPARTTVNHPKRQMSTEDAIKEHIARHGLPPSEEPKKEEKRDRVTGLTKSERRAQLQFYREAKKDFNPQPNEHTPEANIYMRPAETKDIPLIKDLFNRYVRESHATHFTLETDDALWRNELRICNETKCPFVVAILAQSHNRAMQAKDVRRSKIETVVGFAFTADHGAPDNAFRCTLELEIWVDPRQAHQGIGKTLLDRIIACLDPMYSFKDPAPFLAEDPFKWMGGNHRIVKTIMVNMLYSDCDKASLEWRKEWLSRSHFQSGGVIPYIGHKLRKQINLYQMFYTTGHDVSHMLP